MKKEDLFRRFEYFKERRATKEKTWRQLDAYDTGLFWEHVRAKLPTYQLLTDTNYINYIKTNIVNQVYSGGYTATIFAKDFNHDDESDKLNDFVSYIFEKTKLRKYQILAGDRAALLNVGAIQAYWDPDSKDIHGDHVATGDIAWKFIDTMSLYLDPSVADYQKGSALFIAEQVTLEDLKMNAEFKKKIDEFDATEGQQSQNVYGKSYLDSVSDSPKETGTVSLLTAYYKEDGKVHQEIWVNKKIQLVDKELPFDYFPVAVLYNKPAAKDAYGTSVCKLCLQNCLALNILDSIGVTHAYAAQHRATVIRKDAGVSPDYIAENIDNPNAVIAVDGDPRTAVNQVDLPEPPSTLIQWRGQLENSIYLVSGVDPTYTGRNTNSIITTGGVERQQQRVSMTDATSVSLLEEFSSFLTKMIVDFYIQFSNGTYRVSHRDEVTPENNVVYDIDFAKYKKEKYQFRYSINAEPYLPRNSARIAEAGDKIMEMQGQYQFNPPLMTPQEWLRTQSRIIPQAYKIAKRIEFDSKQNDADDIANSLMGFATMTQQGVAPQNALEELVTEKSMMRGRKNNGQ